MTPHEEQVVRLIADPRNRAVLTILNEVARPLSVDELADRLVSQDGTDPDAIVDERERLRMRIALHHETLPKLDEAELVDYDPDENLVSYENYPAVDAEWWDVELLDELLSCFQPATGVDGDGVGVLDGRGDVIEYGRHLADGAEEELFCMYASADLLEEECVRRAAAALDRGVTVSIGSTDTEIRELARERLPDATVWEPQVDWWNDPAGYPKVGRLVFADRERIMLGLLEGRNADGTADETAIVGEGEANPLVVLVRDLLGARLDHLDYQSEDFLEELPFEP